MKLAVNAIGQAELLPGDVVAYGQARFIVDFVNDSRARIVPLEKRRISIETMAGKHAEFSKHDSSHNICPTIAPELILERRGASGLKEFHTQRASRRVANQTEAINNTEPQDDMSKKSTKTTSTETESKPTTKGALGSLMGFSTCAVLRRLGMAGVTVAHGRAIMAKAGVKASDTTVSIQIGNGRNGKGSMAELSKAQVEELKASAPAPAEDPKAEKPAKGGKAKATAKAAKAAKPAKAPKAPKAPKATATEAPAA